MININNTLQIEHCGMGLFETYAEWTHPIIAVDTYELIYCIAGDLKIFEEAERYVVRPGEMLMLEPNRIHGGYDITKKHTAFYWLHFKISDIHAIKIPKLSDALSGNEKAFRKIMHYYLTNMDLAEIALAEFLFEIGIDSGSKSKLAHEIDEYIRVNASQPLTVSEISEKFSYSPDYISKIVKKDFGENLKSRIIRHRLNVIEALLLNTNNSIKQIAGETGFQSENEFVKFFKYNTGTTPTSFRNSFYKVCMNNR